MEKDLLGKDFRTRSKPTHSEFKVPHTKEKRPGEKAICSSHQ